MTIDDLRELRHLPHEVANIKQKIEELDVLRKSPRAPELNPDKVQTSMSGDLNTENEARLQELVCAYNAKVARMLELIKTFEAGIEGMQSRTRHMMRLYYLDGKTWEQVSVDLNMSWRRVHQIRRAALTELLNQ